VTGSGPRASRRQWSDLVADCALGLVDDGVLIWLQVVALGLVAHPGAYLRSPWNQLDAVVVITSIISTAIPNNHVGILKALRLLRVLRPLRMISRFKVTHAFSKCQSDLDQTADNPGTSVQPSCLAEDVMLLLLLLLLVGHRMLKQMQRPVKAAHMTL
jgi:hypothetical protein